MKGASFEGRLWRPPQDDGDWGGDSLRVPEDDGELNGGS